MDKSNGSFWHLARIFVLRFYCLYIILVFLFISNFLQTFHFAAWLNKPFFSITNYLTRFAGRFTSDMQFRDYYQTYAALGLYVFIAVSIAFFWIITDKGKKIPRFFNYTWVFARYYLAAILLGYGISKLFGNQFGRPDFASLIRPLGDFDSRNLFWGFMGASKSYQIFGGLLETAAALLILFRRTATIGCLVALSVLVNVLMLDIAYDVFVKVRIFYFLLLTIFILLPDLKKLFSIFILKRRISLADVQPIIINERYKWAQYVLKFGLISLVIFVILRKEAEVYPQYHYPSRGSISGIYVINQFYSNGRLQQPVSNDSVTWSEIAINNYFPILSIKLMSDSVTDYSFKADTVKKIIDLTSYNNPKLKFRLHYVHIDSNEWIFNGIFKGDSLQLVSKKISKNFILQKKYGETIWDYDF